MGSNVEGMKREIEGLVGSIWKHDEDVVDEMRNRGGMRC